jgi:hypothetical protein
MTCLTESVQIGQELTNAADRLKLLVTTAGARLPIMRVSLIIATLFLTLNAIAVDSASQVIVAAEITQETNDKMQLIPMIAQTVTNLGQKPEKVSADTGYFSEANVTDETVAGIDLHIATGRLNHGEMIEPASGPPPENSTAKQK